MWHSNFKIIRGFDNIIEKFDCKYRRDIKALVQQSNVSIAIGFNGFRITFKS